MKFHTAALQFLVASEALRFGVRAQSVVVDRTSDTNVADAAVSDVLLETPATVADAGVSDVLLETDSGGSGGRFFPTVINNLRVVDSVARGDAAVSDVLLETPADSVGRTHDTVADAGESDVLLETLPVDSGGRSSPSDINNNLY